MSFFISFVDISRVFMKLYWAFVDGSSYSTSDGDERVDLPTYNSKSLY